MSHGHFDHFGGLMPLLERDRGKMHRDLPLYVGGEDTFCYRWFERPNGDRNSAGVVSRSDDAMPGKLILSRSEEHTSELQSHSDLVCRLLLEKKKKKIQHQHKVE